MFVQWECGCQGLIIQVEGKDKPYVIIPCKSDINLFKYKVTFTYIGGMRDQEHTELNEAGIGRLVLALNTVCSKARAAEAVKRALTFL